MTCPKCKHAAEFKGYRHTSPESLLGTIHFRRAYYYCGRCGLGQFPFDEAVGLGPRRVTPGAERVVSLLGLTCDAFEEAAEKVLPEACGLRLSESTVQRITEDAGVQLSKLHEERRAHCGCQHQTLAQGWQIGSGPIESACKTVVGQRLKLAGMRWREYGTDNVCHLRALFRSDKDQWDAFWERKVN